FFLRLRAFVWYNNVMSPTIKFRNIIFLSFCVIFCASLFGCAKKAEAFDLYGYFGDTLTRVVTYETLGDDEEKIRAVCESVDRAVSLSVKNSDVNRFNSAEPSEKVRLSKVGYEIFSQAKELFTLTGGAYNPAVGLLVDLWGFSPRFNSPDYTPTMPYDRTEPSVPAEKYISAFSSEEVTDFSKVTLGQDNDGYYAIKPSGSVTVDGVKYSMQIDLGGIGKGYASDECAKAVSQKDFYVSVGASSLVLGSNAVTPSGAKEENVWKVTLASPRGEKAYASVFAKNVAGSTSGDYQKYFEQNGVRYSHIINPFTGRPIDNSVATVTLFGRTASALDALTTAMSVMGKNDAISFWKEHLSDCDLLLTAYENGKGVIYTNLTEDRLVVGEEFVIQRITA
ncbi:MAG: FAD:protein FMN transferase, partial [Clostridia bacterium]|nr:FAD:protein FMN transferase [Clostridia bacterium]